jgi:hypothetical protein
VRGDSAGGARARPQTGARVARGAEQSGVGGLGAAGSLYVEGDSGIRVVGVLVSRVDLRDRLAACGRRAPRVTGLGFDQRECGCPRAMRSARRAGGGATAAVGAAQRSECLAALREAEAARVEEAIEFGDRRL